MHAPPGRAACVTVCHSLTFPLPLFCPCQSYAAPDTGASPSFLMQRLTEQRENDPVLLSPCSASIIETYIAGTSYQGTRTSSLRNSSSYALLMSQFLHLLSAFKSLCCSSSITAFSRFQVAFIYSSWRFQLHIPSSLSQDIKRTTALSTMRWSAFHPVIGGVYIETCDTQPKECAITQRALY